MLRPQVLYGPITFIDNVTDDFFKHVLERDNALDVSVFVDDDGHVAAGFLESPQQRIEGCGFRHDDRLMDQTWPVNCLFGVFLQLEI